MIVVRQAQMACLAAARRREFARAMCRYLRREFPAQLWAMSAHELQARIEQALADADRHGLRSAQECCRYFNLCVLYGWDFERRDGNAWMTAILDDAEVSSAGMRLQRLIDECIHRDNVDSANRRLRQAFEAELDAHDDDEMSVDALFDADLATLLAVKA